MKTYRNPRLFWRLAVLGATLLLSAFPLLVQSQDKPDKKTGKSVGFVLSEDATEKDVGLPIYPGSQRLKDKSNESSAVKMGLWGGASGFKLAVLKLQSNDSPAKIADFYRKALAKYGQVLDCGRSAAKAETPSAKTNQLTCEDDQPVEGGFTLKAGTKAEQHVVGIEPDGNRSKVALVYVQAPPDNKND